jgi:cytokinin dehydrogenase
MTTDGAEVESLLIDDDATRAEFATDFGAIIRALPRAVVRPRSVDDVVACVRYARKAGIPLVARGGGHSAGGQSQAHDGLVIDMTTLDRIHRVDEAAGYFEADAGVRWADMMDALLARGLAPRVMTDWLRPTLGGTITAGGVGAQTFRHGIHGDLTLQLTVVTGAGELVECSRDQNRDLFDAVRGGLGQYGIIVRVRMTVVPAPERVRLDHLVHGRLETFLADAVKCMEDARIDGIIAHAVPNRIEDIERALGRSLDERGRAACAAAPGKWVYDLQTLRYRDDGELSELSHERALSASSVLTLSEFVHRIPPIVARDRRAGKVPHPEGILFVPHDEALAFIGGVMGSLEPSAMGGGPVLMIPMDKRAIDVPFFRTPASDQFWLFGLLRAAQSEEEIAVMEAANLELYRRSLPIGAVRYPADSLPSPRGPAEWRQHFGPLWPHVEAAKRRFDPDHILTPGLHIFATPTRR